MNFSIGVEYALHTLLYLVEPPQGRTIGVKELATFQGISETYLAKMCTKLKKAGLLRAVAGVKGGYCLARSAEEISFWDVVAAIEGQAPFFQCAEIRQKAIILDPQHLPDVYCKTPCLIHTVMDEAEERFRAYLQGKTLRWLYEEVKCKMPAEDWERKKSWFTMGAQ